MSLSSKQWRHACMGVKERPILAGSGSFVATMIFFLFFFFCIIQISLLFGEEFYRLFVAVDDFRMFTKRGKNDPLEHFSCRDSYLFFFSFIPRCRAELAPSCISYTEYDAFIEWPSTTFTGNLETG